MSIAKRILTSKFFTRSQDSQTTFAVIKWWEIRRFAYNGIVGLTGITAILLTLGLIAIWPGPKDKAPDFPNPLFFLFVVLLYAAGANVCYTGGWICELLLKRFWSIEGRRFSEIALTLGIAFSILLTLAPVLFFTGVAILAFVFAK